jgi:predicted molibdopterin-dependent oxidoreductase YjgC
MNLPNTVQLQVNGRALTIAAGTSVAAALRVADQADMGAARRSVQGEARAPFCGMGICQECRVNIDGRRRLACQTCCADGMVVETTS